MLALTPDTVVTVVRHVVYAFPITTVNLFVPKSRFAI
jgi:hypothetical protein